MILDVFVVIAAVICIYIASSGFSIKRRKRDNQVLSITIIASTFLIINQIAWIVDYRLLGIQDNGILDFRSFIEIMFLMALSLFGLKR